MKGGDKGRCRTLDRKRLEGRVDRPFGSETRACRIAEGIDGKNCENGVADEFEHLTAIRLDLVNDAFEKVVEQGKQLFLAHRRRSRREGTKVSEQYGRVDRAARAAQYGASFDFRGRAATDVSGKQTGRGAAHGVRFQSCTDEREQSLERRDMLCTESIRCVADDAHGLGDAVAIVQR